MLRHVNAPSRRFTKVSNDLVRHPRLNPEAKLLLIYVQGLPESDSHKPLSEHAAKLKITGRAYQRAKELLIACGYLHTWREQGARGQWFTHQMLANVTLTGEEASRIRDGVPPSAQSPTVGEPTGRFVGDSPPEDKTEEKTTPHLPPQEPGDAARGEAEPPESELVESEAADSELAEAERVLLSLRHQHRELHLGAREARGLAATAAQWLKLGVTPADLRHALTHALPRDGIRSAVGFLRHRLIEKLPAAASEPVAPSPRTPGAVTLCEGTGPEHAFRPLGDETHCGRCRTDGPVPAARDSDGPSGVLARGGGWRGAVAAVGANV